MVGLAIENTRLYNDLERQVAQRTEQLREALARAQEADRLKGQFLAAAPLHPVSTATSVRVRDGRRQVTDGPFAETREYLGGYYLIDCESRERAVELAAMIPDAKVDGLGVEVRQVMYTDGELDT